MYSHLVTHPYTQIPKVNNSKSPTLDIVLRNMDTRKCILELCVISAFKSPEHRDF